MVDDSVSRMLFDAASMAAGEWCSTDDPVMGGESRSNMEEGPEETVVFAGHVSLANNGGFASIHRPLEQGLLSGYGALSLRVCGDGRRYSLRLRQEEAFDGISWRQDFDTRAGEWQTVVLPFSGFRAVFRGRELPTAGPLDLPRVNRVGLLIGRQPGPFRLRLRWIQAVRRT
ncbi:MAG: CIA30 family protein [Pseudohongiellaceae bacterium]